MKDHMLTQLKALFPSRLKHKIKDFLGLDKKSLELSNAQKCRIEKEILKGMDSGINAQLRQEKIVVSLTSFPARIKSLHFTLYSLFKQSMKPDVIVLYLAEEQFPNREASLPKSVLAFVRWGLTIRWCKDIKSYKKLIFTLQDYPDTLIITVDDDLFYAENLVKVLLGAYKEMPNCVHTLRGHRITFDEKSQLNPYEQWRFEVQNVKPSYNNIQTGVMGVLYPPNCFDKDILREDLFMKLCPTADDIWFWAMSVLNGKKINIVNHTFPLILTDLKMQDSETLCNINITCGGNDKQLKALFDYYPQLKTLIKFDSALYWEERYMQEGNSGAGSYGRLADFKAEILNDFVQKHNCETVIEWGVGDGNQLSLFKFKSYIGIDVAETVVVQNQKRFALDSTKSFYLAYAYMGEGANLSLSLDVIYHLIEDAVFEDYMKKLFASSTQYVCIYASNKDECLGQHVKHRKFTDWVEKNQKNFKQILHIPNRYPYDLTDLDHTSFADFYFFEKN